jgi:hypothetical protein
MQNRIFWGLDHFYGMRGHSLKRSSFGLQGNVHSRIFQEANNGFISSHFINCNDKLGDI